MILTNNTFEAEEVDLSIPEIERLLKSIRRRRQVENVMASVSAVGIIAADVAFVSGTGLFGLFGVGWLAVAYVVFNHFHTFTVRRTTVKRISFASVTHEFEHRYVYSKLERVDPNDNTSRWRFNDVPSEMSNLIGMLEHARLQETEKFLDDDSELAQRLYAVGGMVCRESEIYDLGFGRRAWTFHCVDSDEMNAFVIPGGHIYVHRGMLEAFKSSEELAVILAHEVSHIKARHLDERISISSRFPFIIKCCFFIFKVFGGFEVIPQFEPLHGIKVVDLAWKALLELPYSRLHETEADRMGCHILLKLCIHPDVAVSVWETMEERGVGNTGIGEIMSTHPNSTSRRRELQNMVSVLIYFFLLLSASIPLEYTYRYRNLKANMRFGVVR